MLRIANIVTRIQSRYMYIASHCYRRPGVFKYIKPLQTPKWSWKMYSSCSFI